MTKIIGHSLLLQYVEPLYTILVVHEFFVINMYAFLIHCYNLFVNIIFAEQFVSKSVALMMMISVDDFFVVKIYNQPAFENRAYYGQSNRRANCHFRQHKGRPSHTDWAAQCENCVPCSRKSESPWEILQRSWIIGKIQQKAYEKHLHLSLECRRLSDK